MYNESPFIFYCTIWYEWILWATRQVFSIVIYHRNERQNAQWLIACLGKLWKWMKNDLKISERQQNFFASSDCFVPLHGEIKLLSMEIYEALQSRTMKKSSAFAVSDESTEIELIPRIIICMEIWKLLATETITVCWLVNSGIIK